MVKIVNVEEGVIRPTDEVLLIEPFRSIWKRDKNSHKVRALNDFKFIEFMVSPLSTNPYKDLEEGKRESLIITEIFEGEYKPDKKVKEAIELYLKWLYEYSFSYRFYKSSIKGANELTAFFNELDINERTKSGMAVYKPSDLTRALKDVDEIIRNLKKLESRIFEEVKEIRIKGNKDINPLEV